MATVTGYTAARTQAIEDSNIQGGHIDGSGHLILEAHDGSTVDAGYMLATVPSASDTVAGIVELATDAEATSGVDTARAVTPHALAAAVGALVPAASDTVAGKVQLATDAEATAATDTTKAVTPHALGAAIASGVPDATDTVKGKVELATPTEATTGTDTTRAVTPEGLKAAIDAVLQLIYPVGSYYVNDSDSTSPATTLGFGTWTAVQAETLIGADGATYVAATTGGAETHTIGSANLPTHVHGAGTLAADSGGGHVHSVRYKGGSFTDGTNRIYLRRREAADSYDGEDSDAADTSGAHGHTISGSTSDGGFANTAINHMNPWRAVYMWRRTA